MTAKRGLTTPTIEVNDEVIEYKPNSLTFKSGIGDLTVRHQTAGGGAGSEVITEDATTKVGMVKFTLYTERSNVDKATEWARISRNLAGNVIRISDNGFTRAFRAMRLTTDPEITAGSDGEFELEFMGGRAAS